MKKFDDYLEEQYAKDSTLRARVEAEEVKLQAQIDANRGPDEVCMADRFCKCEKNGCGDRYKNGVLNPIPASTAEGELKNILSDVQLDVLISALPHQHDFAANSKITNHYEAKLQALIATQREEASSEQAKNDAKMFKINIADIEQVAVQKYKAEHGLD